MMKYTKIIILLLVMVLLLAGCKKDEAEPDEVVDAGPTPVLSDEVPIDLEGYTFTPETFPRLDGSPGTLPLAEALSAVMLGGSREDAQHLGSFTATAQAYRNLADGLCDMIIAGEPYPPVIDEISRQDYRYTMTPIALDALVFIVSSSNPVSNLSSEQIRAIYSGELTGWQQVGGDNLDIAAYQRNEEAMSQVLMEMLVMDWAKMADAPMQTILSGYSMYGDDAAPSAIKGFDGSANAIGYTMYYYASNMKMAAGYKILSVDGIMPTPDTIASGDYPFTSPYYAVVSQDLPEDDGAHILYSWLLTSEGQDFISSEGYVSVLEAQAPGSDAPELPQEMRWSVTTDSSKLTAFDNPKSRYTRLRDTALPELEPFSGYGTLLPYSTAVTMNDGSINAVKYGFVTVQSGTVVTDPIYDGIDRAFCLGQTGDTALPAYRLHISMPENDFGYRTIQAACADDGSWITPFKYESIVFRNDIFFCQYEYDFHNSSFDIDVYDYNGNLLYNILDLEWSEKISEGTWSDYLMYSINEGYGFIQFDDGTPALFDALTGNIRDTDFADAAVFSDGLVAFEQRDSGGLWGFADKNLDVVIPAAYAGAGVFIDGRAVVETPDRAAHVIDTSGKVLFTAEPGYRITSLDGYGYALSSTSHEFAPARYYTYDFNEISYPPEALPLSAESETFHLREGWILCTTENGTWIFNATESYALPSSVQRVDDIINGRYILYVENTLGFSESFTGVMLLDGTLIITPAENMSVTPVFRGDALIYFIANNDRTDGGAFNFINETYTNTEYSIIDPSGQAIKNGHGILLYDATVGCMYVQGSDYFALLDSDGNISVSIPSMGYTID